MHAVRGERVNSTPPRARDREARAIHDAISQREESLGNKGLGEEVRQVISGAYERYHDAPVLYHVADEEVTAVDMFGTLVMLRAVGKINGRLVVHEQGQGEVRAVSEL